MPCAICYQKVAKLCGKCGSCKSHHAEDSTEFPMRKCRAWLAQCPLGHARCTGCGNCTTCKQICTCAKYLLNPLPRTLGVELELSNLGGINKMPPKNKHISYHFEHDGSVTSGQELVTGIMQGDQYIYGMSELIKSLQEFGCKTDKTCGYHVHVDALTYTPFDLRRVMIGFCTIQHQLFGTLVAKARESNMYCPPIPLVDVQLHDLAALEKPGQVSRWFYKYLYGLDSEPEGITAAEKLEQQRYVKRRLAELKAHKYENAARRQALNFHSWMMRGTIEFRCKEGTTDPEDLLLWPLWCGWFIHKLGLMDDKEVFSWLKKPPTIQELSSRLTLKGRSPSMPESIMQWVERKCEQAKPKAKRASQEPF